MRLERARTLRDALRSAELGELCHLESREAAGVDAAKRRKIERHIQGKPVVAAATAHAHADARELAADDVYPRRIALAIHYRVANGEALVEILGKPRPYDKIVFVRKILEETPYATEERLDDEMPDGQTMLDQPGFNGYKLTRFRRFYQGKKMVREQKWTVNYKPVTEYVRRGTNPDPNTPMPKEKEIHPLTAPKPEEFDAIKEVRWQ